MKKLFFVSIVLGLFLVTVLSGCGGGGGVPVPLVAVVSTFAGTAGVIGSTDGTGASALFQYPDGIIADDSDNLYVSDWGNNTIRMITPAGVVSTIAGTAGLAGSTDGTGADARFNGPGGIAIDSGGNLYVCDNDNHTIRKITPAGVVSTFAGTAGLTGSTDGTGAAARFNHPTGITIDSHNNLYVVDRFNFTIRKITPAGVVTTFVGTAGLSGSADGTGASARFEYPSNLTVDTNDNLYLTDMQNYTIRKITPAGVVTTIAGTATQSGSTDGTGAAARFFNPVGITIDNQGNLYVADRNNYTIRKITPSGVVTTIAGTAGHLGSTDGTGTAARFNDPEGITIDGSGNLFVTDIDNQIIRKIIFQ